MKLNLIYFTLVSFFIIADAAAHNGKIDKTHNRKVKTVKSTFVDPNTSQIIVNAGILRGTRDVTHLKYLASGVGWEFSPNGQTTAELKRIGIKTIRCINIEPLPGTFKPDGTFLIGQPTSLLNQLKTCKEIGATPHLCIATALPDALRLQPKAVPSNLSEEVKKNVYGPTDLVRFRNYYKAFFKYIIKAQGFTHAQFEVGNEPDLGAVFPSKPPIPAPGSAAAYEAYMNFYRNIAQAATEFEKENPGCKVILGGPALSWAFTFKYGAFNWSARFIKDVGEQKLKCDFIGVHYYGNQSSQNDEFKGGSYPSFTAMLKVVNAARMKYSPGKPVWITEWGPSYRTDNSLSAKINGDQMGAAWSAAFLSTMLQNNVNDALFLLTTDNLQKSSNGSLEDVWGWPALFVNPLSVGDKAYPKPIFHVFEMVSRLNGKRVAVQAPPNGPGVFSCINSTTGTLKIMLWNYHQIITEYGNPKDNSVQQPVNVIVKGLPKVFAAGSITVSRWQVSENDGNAATLNAKGIQLTNENTRLPMVETVNTKMQNGVVAYNFNIPPSGVCLIEIKSKRAK